MRKLVAMIAVLALAFSPQCITLAQEATQEAEEDINLANCTEDEYRANCYELWYDDVIFGNAKELRNKYVRLELFVEEQKEIDMFAAQSNYSTLELIEDYGLEHTFYQCGVKREPGSMSYVGEPIHIFFGEAYGTHATQVGVNDHIVIFGKIISSGYNAWTGYNQIYVLPRMIENYG